LKKFFARLLWPEIGEAGRNGHEPIKSEVFDAMSENDDLTIGIEIMPGEATPARGIIIPQDSIPMEGAAGLSSEDVARISAETAASVREMIMERIEHIISHAVTEAVEAQLKQYIIEP